MNSIKTTLYFVRLLTTELIKDVFLKNPAPWHLQFTIYHLPFGHPERKFLLSIYLSVFLFIMKQMSKQNDKIKLNKNGKIERKITSFVSEIANAKL